MSSLRRAACLLAALATTSSLIGIGAAPAGAVDDAPSAKAATDPVALARAGALISPGALSDYLEQAFPDSFGGIFATKDDGSAYTIQIKGDRKAIADAISARVSAAAALTSVLPATSMGSVKRSLAELKAASVDAAANGAADDVSAVGPDIRNNALVVFTAKAKDKPAADAIKAKVTARRGVPVSDVRTAGPTTAVSRTSDFSPWAPGDQIVSSLGIGCTLGWGGHNNLGHWVLTAGHCKTDGWFNTSYASATFTNATFVGTTGSNAWPGITGQNVIDLQAIPARGSLSFWKPGNSGALFKVAYQGHPVQGQQACLSGSFSNGTGSCGTIPDGATGLSVPSGSPNFPQYIWTAAFQFTGNGCFGDSGAPVYAPTPWGYAAIGIEVGAAIVSGSCGAQVTAQDISTTLAFSGWNMQVDTLANPG